MNIAEIREKYPQYDSIPDQQLADALHEKYYPQLEKEDFYQRINFTPGQVDAFAPAARAPEVEDAFVPTRQFTPEERAAREEERQREFFAGTPEEVMARIKREDRPLEDPFVDPVAAVAGPLGVAQAAKWAGRPVQSLAASLATSIAAEPVVGTVQEKAHKALGEQPWYIQTASDIALGMGLSVAVEGALTKGLKTVQRKASKLGEVTEEAVTEIIDRLPKSQRKALKQAELLRQKEAQEVDVSPEGAIRRFVTGGEPAPRKPQIVPKEAVRGIVKAGVKRGTLTEDLPEVPVPGVTPGQVELGVVTFKKPEEGKRVLEVGTPEEVPLAQEKFPGWEVNVSKKPISPAEPVETPVPTLVKEAEKLPVKPVTPKKVVEAPTTGEKVDIEDGVVANITVGRTSLLGPGVTPESQEAFRIKRRRLMDMEGAGRTPQEIFDETGMFRAADGRVKEVAAEGVRKIKVPETSIEETVSLRTLLDDPEYFSRYPETRDIEVDLKPEARAKVSGSYAAYKDGPKGVGKIMIRYPGGDPGSIEEVLSHEVTHVVQEIEGWARGGSTDEIKRAMRKHVNKKAELEDNLKQAISPEERAGIEKKIRRERHYLNELGFEKEYKAYVGAGRNLTKKIVEDYSSAVQKAYKRIAGEEEAFQFQRRAGLKPDDPLKKKVPKVRDDVIFISKYLHPGTVGGSIAGMGNGVDWEEYEKSGTIVIDPEAMFKGMLYGAAIGSPRLAARGISRGVEAGVMLPIKTANKLAEGWTSTVDKVLGHNPLTSLASKIIVNENLRNLIGLKRNPQVKKALDDFNTGVSQVLQFTREIAEEIERAAPNKIARKRLLQVMKGSITSDMALAERASKLNQMFETFRGRMQELDLMHYSAWDGLKKREIAGLRKVIKDPKSSPNDVLVAQSMLDDHYHLSGQNYVPGGGLEVGGLRKAQRDTIKKEIKRLTRKSRLGDPEGKQDIEEVIYELKDLLSHDKIAKKGKKLSLDKGYTIRRKESSGQVDVAKHTGTYKSRQPEPLKGKPVPDGQKRFDVSLLSKDTQRIVGDLIQESYTVASAARRQGLDINKANLFKTIKEIPGAVLPKDHKGPKPANYTQLHSRAGKMDVGALNGRWVRKDIATDLTEALTARHYIEEGMDKFLAPWKSAVVVYNPGSHIKNGVSGFFFSHLGGVSPWDVKTYASTAKALKEGRANRMYQEAEQSGLYANTFVNVEAGTLFNDLEKIKDGKALTSWIGKVSGFPAKVYEGNDKFFKTALFIKAREGGMSIEQAKNHAEEFMFNYQDIPPAVKHLKRWVHPFFTWAYKSKLAVAKSAIREPWKIGLLLGGVAMANQYTQDEWGIDDETLAKEKEDVTFDGSTLKKFGQVLMPFPDDYGNHQYLNVGDYMPWETFQKPEFAPTHPIMKNLFEVPFNVEFFTGKEIYDETWDTGWEIWKKKIGHVLKSVAPPLATYHRKRLVDAIQNEFAGTEILDGYDRPQSMFDATMRALTGFKLTPAVQEKHNKYVETEIRKLKSLMNREVKKAVKKEREGTLSREELTLEVKRLQGRYSELIDRAIGGVIR